MTNPDEFPAGGILESPVDRRCQSRIGGTSGCLVDLGGRRRPSVLKCHATRRAPAAPAGALLQTKIMRDRQSRNCAFSFPRPTATGDALTMQLFRRVSLYSGRYHTLRLTSAAAPGTAPRAAKVHFRAWCFPEPNHGPAANAAFNTAPSDPGHGTSSSAKYHQKYPPT